MSMKSWERKVLRAPGAADRVAEIEDEMRLAVGLTSLREQANLSQRALAERLGVSQPRIAKIERSANVTVVLLEQYVRALGGDLEISVVKGRRRVTLLGPTAKTARRRPPPRAARTDRQPNENGARRPRIIG